MRTAGDSKWHDIRRTTAECDAPSESGRRLLPEAIRPQTLARRFLSAIDASRPSPSCRNRGHAGPKDERAPELPVLPNHWTVPPILKGPVWRTAPQTWL